MLQIEDLRDYLSNETIILTDHLLSRMRQRHIRFTDIKHAIENGEIIEQYTEDYPFPSCLINGNNIHVVCSIGEDRLYIITAYHPSSVQWEDGGRKRRTNKGE
ncbi:MAG: DUF4258 domain-containing protein [Treponema sp.]|jgi:hypothetical protein|nr:DUF4258 domain-containing protein [Treponema sp.]